MLPQVVSYCSQHLVGCLQLLELCRQRWCSAAGRDSHVLRLQNYRVRDSVWKPGIGIAVPAATELPSPHPMVEKQQDLLPALLQLLQPHGTKIVIVDKLQLGRMLAL